MMKFTERCPYYIEKPLAVVIGCGDMGMGCARALGRRAPLLIADIDDERLAGCIAELRHDGYTATGLQCDITDPDQVIELGNTLAVGPGVRVLAHVAAVGNAPGGWRQVMEVDLVGAHLVLDTAGPHMVRGGVAILISSTGSYHSRVGESIDTLLDHPLQASFLDKLAGAFGREPDFLEAYFMAKRGVNRLAQKRAIAWGEREVRVVSVSPGLIDSTMGRTSGSALPLYGGGEKKRMGSRSEKATKEVPLGRQGTLLEITSVVEFLASDGASFINGIDVPVDGGSLAQWRERHNMD